MRLRTRIARKLHIDKFVKWLGLYGTLDTEKMIRVLKTENIHLKQALAEAQEYMPWNKERVTLEIDKAGQKQAQSQIGTYEPPERNTDKPMVFPETHGRYFRQRWPEFRKTHLMPTVKRPPQDEPPSLMEMTQIRIPTWIL